MRETKLIILTFASTAIDESTIKKLKLLPEISPQQLQIMKQIEDSKSANESSQNPSTAIAAKPDRSRAIVLGAMCLALFMTNFDGTSTDIALPQIQRSLGANVADIQWILNAYHLPVASLLLATGKFGDLYGRKRIFIYGLIIFTVASAICGFAPNLEILIAGRSLQGIGGAALIPPFPDHSYRYLPRSRRKNQSN